MGRFYRDTNDGALERRTAAIDRAGASELAFVQALLTPGRVFENPHEVVRYPWFTDEEKRAVLTSWAHEELAVEHMARKLGPKLKPEPRTDHVIEALAEFDAAAAGEYLSAVRTI